jgi:hypothetical protein
MVKASMRDLDNLMRLIVQLPPDDAERVMRAVKKEKDPEGKRRLIKKALDKAGMSSV